MAWKDVEDAPHLSASQIAMYLRCPKQYEYRYIKRMVRPPTFSLVVGKSVHSSIELNYKKKFKAHKAENRGVCLDAYSDAFNKGKWEVEEGKIEAGRQKDRGLAMAEAHYDFIAPTLQPLEAPEIEFTVSVPGVKRKLYGFMDVIGAPTSGFKDVPAAKAKIAKPKRMIIDNKTASRKKQRLDVELSLQLTAYDFAHREIFGSVADGVGFDTMVSSPARLSDEVEVQRLVTTRDAAERVRFVETVVAVDKGITAGVFPPVDNPFTCSWCGYAQICNKAAMRRSASNQGR